jgi:nicotinamidase-related amidase
MVGTPDWELVPELAPRPGEPVIRKKRYGAFLGTGLEKRLRRARLTDIVIGGVMTNCCCETTARHAFDLDFRVHFLVDGTAAPRRELHVASLVTLGYGFAYMATCDEVRAWLMKSEERRA